MPRTIELNPAWSADHAADIILLLERFCEALWKSYGEEISRLEAERSSLPPIATIPDDLPIKV